MPHPVAVAGFSVDPERYEAGRPGYPDSATRLLTRGLRHGDLVVDVGAGTGKLTRVLVDTEATVLAVDPVSEMLRIARRFAPTAHLVIGSAEQLPVPSGAAAAVTAAQAFHWFDAERCWDEFARVLRPGGVAGLIWNARLRDIEWVDRIWSVMDRFERTAPWRDHDRGERFAQHQAFSPVERSSVHHTVAMDRESITARVMSVSHIAVLPDTDQERVRAEISEILDAVERPLEITYRTDVLIRRRL